MGSKQSGSVPRVPRGHGPGAKGASRGGKSRAPQTRRWQELLKLFLFFAVLIVGYVAYAGVDVTGEYDSVSKVRNVALNEVVDPIAKKVLTQAAGSNLDEVIEKSIERYQKETTERG